jgi:hypothetical protein
MKARLYEKKADKKASIAISLVFHVFAIAAIASITFRYPLAAFFGLQKEKIPVERIQYVTVQPRRAANAGNGASEDKPKKAKKKETAPAMLLPPVVTPTASSFARTDCACRSPRRSGTTVP